MFGNVRISWQLGKMKGRVRVCIRILEEIKRNLELINEIELGNALYNEGLAHMNEAYETYSIWVANPRMVDKQRLNELDAMQYEMMTRLELQRDMIKSQGSAYVETMKNVDVEEVDKYYAI